MDKIILPICILVFCDKYILCAHSARCCIWKTEKIYTIDEKSKKKQKTKCFVYGYIMESISVNSLCARNDNRYVQHNCFYFRMKDNGKQSLCTRKVINFLENYM